MSDWNTQVIERFRANHGEVGGDFDGLPMVLLHHRGRRSGADHVTPLMYLAADGDVDTVYVFASKAGSPDHPEWYRNLVASGRGRVELGDEEYDVAVVELAGDERDRVFSVQAERYDQFAGYAEKTAGVRTIPVLALRRAR